MSKSGFDISGLRNFAMDEAEIKEFIQEFIHQSVQDISNLKNLAQLNDTDGIRQLIHRMKNILLLLTVEPVLTHIQKLEGMNNDDPEFYDRVNLLTNDLNTLIDELRKSVPDNIG